jgi:hypothetical protein
MPFLLLPRVYYLRLFPFAVLPPGPGGTLSPFRLLDCDSPGNVELNADGDGAVRVSPPCHGYVTPGYVTICELMSCIYIYPFVFGMGRCRFC